MTRWNIVGTCLLGIGTLTGGAALAATPTKADMDFCNQKAAGVSKPSPVQPGTSTPGTTGRPSAGTNATGGRITDSTQPGTPPSENGMARAGDTDPAYRQAYLACLNERHK
ncbi:MAG TPA: hypothetical protein VJX92_10215 [Methylomirabilota bacterium]|nr:hypothetical protein [Methylomirabilota bacterium]